MNEQAYPLVETPRRQSVWLFESTFDMLFENNLHPMWVYDLETLAFLAVNTAAIHHYGYSRDEFLALTIADIRPPEDVPALRENIAQVTDGLDQAGEWRHCRKDGVVIVVEITSHTLTFAGRPAELVLAHDITARQRAEEALHASEARFHRLAEHAHDLIYRYRFAPERGFEYVSPSATAITGYTPEEHYADPDLGFKLVHPDDRPLLEAASRGNIDAGAPLTLRWMRKDGSIIWTEQQNVPIYDGHGQLIAVEGIARDVTARQQAEVAWHAGEARFRALIENSADAIALIAADGTIIYESPAATRILGFATEEMVGRSVFDFIHPDNLANCAALFERLLQDPDQPVTSQLRYQHNDGSWRWVEATCANLLAEPAVRAIVANYRDITDRQQAAEALARERNLLRTLIDHLPDRIYVKDASARFLIKNWADVRAMGAASPDEVVGKSDFDYYPLDQAAQYMADDWAVLQSGQPLINHEEPTTGADNAHRWILTTKVPLRDEHGQVTGLVGIGRDITERKQMEAENQRRLGELEAVAHISAALRAAQMLDEMLPILLDETLAVLGADTGSVLLYDAARGHLRHAVGRGWFTTIDQTPLQPGEGMAGRVFATGEVIHTSEFVSDPRAREASRAQIPLGWGGACIPIRTAQKVVGVMFISIRAPRELMDDEIRLLTTLAEIAGNAIHRTHLHEQTEKRLQQVQALQAIDAAITSSFDLRLTLDVVLEQVVTQLGADAATVLLFSPKTHLLKYAAGRGFRSSAIQHAQLRLGEGYAGQAAFERRRVHVPNVLEAGGDLARALVLTNEAFVAYDGVPLIAKGEVKGVLEVFHRAPLHSDPEWLNFLEALAGQAAIAVDNAQLFESLQRSNLDLIVAYDTTLEGWSRALDLRDKETEGHSQRVTELTLRLARAIGMSDAELVQVRRGALLHDIGKMGVPDAILLKPGKLTDDEWVVMRKHPTFAHDLLQPIAYLRPALDIPYYHHEKWDGTGYPRQLKGEAIPLSARIFAVVDVWDALRSDRPYRPAWPQEKVLEHLRAGSGTHFDPEVVQAFLRVIEV